VGSRLFDELGNLFTDLEDALSQYASFSMRNFEDSGNSEGHGKSGRSFKSIMGGKEKNFIFRKQ